MPLPMPAPRDEIHLRDLIMRVYRRHDGLFDVEGRLTDRKTESFRMRSGGVVAPMDAIHDVSVRLVIDLDMRIHDVEAASDSTPFTECRTAPATLKVVVGLDLGGGWVREVRARLSGARGCTHHVDVLIALGTAAFQALAPLRRGLPEALDATGKPRLLDSCIAFARGGAIALREWPEHHGETTK